MNRSEITFWVFIVLSLICSAIVLSATAKATDLGWPHDQWSPEYSKQGHRVRKRSKPRPDVRYYAPPRPEFDRTERFCLGPVRGVGTQWVGTEGALDAAMKDWRERTRYDYGEIFVDMTHAEDFRQRCGRTSIGETMGQIFYRCEIWARPCKADFAEGEAPKK